MERALVPDVSLVKAHIADRSGNLVFRKTARNFNPNVAMAGKMTVVEVEEIVETGTLDPDQVHLPASMCTGSWSTPPRKSASSNAPLARPKENTTWHGPAMKWRRARRANCKTVFM